MKPIECELILHGSCKQFSGGGFPSINAAKKWIKDCWERPYTIVRKDKMKLSIPTFDDNLRFIKNITIEINKKIGTNEYNRITQILPGMCVGYCEDIYSIAETKTPIEIIHFYDIRQKGVKKLKGYFIKVL
jgi:hypothetical protein